MILYYNLLTVAKDLTLLTELRCDLGSLLALKGVAAGFSVGFDKVATGIFSFKIFFSFSSSGFVGTLLGFLTEAGIVHILQII